MQNSITPLNSYEEAKKQAKELYGKIQNVWRPALEESVEFDETGFRHLIQKGRKFRTKSEQKRRFALLAHAEEILKNPGVKFFRDPHSRNPDINYWIFEEKLEDKKIKLIVQQVGNGKKHFLSIYGKTQKPTQ